MKMTLYFLPVFWYDKNKRHIDSQAAGTRPASMGKSLG